MRPCLKLRQRCMEMDYTFRELAEEIGRSPSYLSQMMCGTSEANASDIYAIAQVLEIPPKEWDAYFFPPEICKKLEQKIKERKGTA